MMCVGIGAAIGSLIRFNLTAFGRKRWGTDFPVATLVINLTGAFLLGIVRHTDAALLVGTGILGGYTTFSTYNVELLTLLRNGECVRAAAYFVAGGVLGPVCALCGWYLGTLI